MDDTFLQSDMPPEGSSLSEDLKKPSLLQVSVLYSIAVILLFFVSRFVSSKLKMNETYGFYWNGIITEVIFVAAPAIIMLLIYKYDLKQVLRFNRIDIINSVLVVAIVSFALPVVGVLNGINLVIIKSIFGKVIINQPPAAEDFGTLVLSLLVIGASAGICEELLFRGTILRGFERFGAVKAILITAFLFGLMHLDFQKLLGTFLLGALIGFIVYRSNSIFGGMIAHFTNNSIAVVLMYISTVIQKVTKAQGGANAAKLAENTDIFSMLNSLPADQRTTTIIALIIFGVVALAFFGGFLALFLYVFIVRTRSNERVEKVREKIDLRFILGLSPGVAIIIFTYLAEGLKLKGITIPVMNQILELLGH